MAWQWEGATHQQGSPQWCTWSLSLSQMVHSKSQYFIILWKCVSVYLKNIICVVNAKVSLYNQLYVTNMDPFHVSFKATSCNAWKFADCASLRLFPRVGHFVLLKIVWSSWRIVTLIAQLRFFSSVRHNVDSRISTSIGWIVALCAPVLLLSSVGE